MLVSIAFLLSPAAFVSLE